MLASYSEQKNHDASLMITAAYGAAMVAFRRKKKD
jgi:hypothetical protein